MIKQESVDNDHNSNCEDVFVDYLVPKVEIRENFDCHRDVVHHHHHHHHTGEWMGSLHPLAQSPAFPTPVSPSPLSPMTLPSTSKFFPQHFHSSKFSAHASLSAPSTTLLSPAPSLHGSSQEELAHCRSSSWNCEESELEDDKFGNGQTAAAKEELTEGTEEALPTPGTSDLCDRFQRFDFVIPGARNNHHQEKQSSSYCPSSSYSPCPCPSVNDETSLPQLASVPASGQPPPAKRPMNGFMLFAQKYRLQLIQQFPGRDNRYALRFAQLAS